MKIIMDGRLLESRASGVRDVAVGMSEGLRKLSDEGLIDFETVGSDAPPSLSLSIDRRIPSRGFMHVGLPNVARKAGADAIFVPRQTRPVLSPVPVIPLIHDVGFWRVPDLYPASKAIQVSTRIASTSRVAAAVSAFTASEMRVFGFKQQIVDLGLGAAHKLDWTPNSIDPFILCVGVQTRHKNLLRLVRAWKLAKTEGVRLVICAKEGDETAAIKDELRDWKPSSINLVQGLSDDRYQELLSTCTGYIQPSLYEGLCVPVMDVAAAGVPVAVSSDGNTGSVFAGLEGAVFDPHSDWAIAESVERLIGDTSYRSRASEWNLRNIRLTDWTESARALAGAIR